MTSEWQPVDLPVGSLVGIRGVRVTWTSDGAGVNQSGSLELRFSLVKAGQPFVMAQAGDAPKDKSKDNRAADQQPARRQEQTPRTERRQATGIEGNAKPAIATPRPATARIDSTDGRLADAGKSEPAEVLRGFTEHVVQSGESLWVIAERALKGQGVIRGDVSKAIEAIVESSQRAGWLPQDFEIARDAKRLRADQRLAIPGDLAERVQPKGAPEPQQPEPALVELPPHLVHPLQLGESPWRVAKQVLEDALGKHAVRVGDIDRFTKEIIARSKRLGFLPEGFEVERSDATKMRVGTKLAIPTDLGSVLQRPEIPPLQVPAAIPSQPAMTVPPTETLTDRFEPVQPAIVSEPVVEPTLIPSESPRVIGVPEEPIPAVAPEPIAAVPLKGSPGRTRAWTPIAVVIGLAALGLAAAGYLSFLALRRLEKLVKAVNEQKARLSMSTETGPDHSERKRLQETLAALDVMKLATNDVLQAFQDAIGLLDSERARLCDASLQWRALNPEQRERLHTLETSLRILERPALAPLLASLNGQPAKQVTLVGIGLKAIAPVVVAARLGLHVVAIQESTSALALLKQDAGSSATAAFLAGQAHSIPLADNTADRLLFIDLNRLVSTHLEDVLHELLRVTKVGGVMHVTPKQTEEFWKALRTLAKKAGILIERINATGESDGAYVTTLDGGTRGLLVRIIRKPSQQERELLDEFAREQASGALTPERIERLLSLIPEDLRNDLSPDGGATTPPSSPAGALPRSEQADDPGGLRPTWLRLIPLILFGSWMSLLMTGVASAAPDVNSIIRHGSSLLLPDVEQTIPMLHSVWAWMVSGLGMVGAWWVSVEANVAHVLGGLDAPWWLGLVITFGGESRRRVDTRSPRPWDSWSERLRLEELRQQVLAAGA